MLVLRASLTARRPARRAPGSARLARRRRSPCPPRVRLARRVACAPACACVPPLAAAPTPLPSRPAGTEQSDPRPIAQGGASRAEGPLSTVQGGDPIKTGRWDYRIGSAPLEARDRARAMVGARLGRYMGPCCCLSWAYAAALGPRTWRRGERREGARRTGRRAGARGRATGVESAGRRGVSEWRRRAGLKAAA